MVGDRHFPLTSGLPSTDRTGRYDVGEGLVAVLPDSQGQWSIASPLDLRRTELQHRTIRLTVGASARASAIYAEGLPPTSSCASLACDDVVVIKYRTTRQICEVR
jgi:hypothetical protein